MSRRHSDLQLKRLRVINDDSIGHRDDMLTYDYYHHSFSSKSSDTDSMRFTATIKFIRLVIFQFLALSISCEWLLFRKKKRWSQSSRDVRDSASLLMHFEIWKRMNDVAEILSFHKHSFVSSVNNLFIDTPSPCALFYIHYHTSYSVQCECYLYIHSNATYDRTRIYYSIHYTVNTRWNKKHASMC